MKGFVQIVEALIIAVVLVLLYQWVKAAGSGLLKIPNPFDGFKIPNPFDNLWPKTDLSEDQIEKIKKEAHDQLRDAIDKENPPKQETGSGSNSGGGSGATGGGGGHPYKY